MEKIIFCGGGTLGHFTPNIAIYENLKSTYDFFYICSQNGMEKKMLENVMPYAEIPTAKLIRSFSLKNLLLPFKLIKSTLLAKKILREQKPALIFSKGGFASVPVVLAGKMLKIPCITHESDRTLGLANKLIAKKCKYVCTSFKETANLIKNGIYTGTPIRKQIFNGNKHKVIKRHALNTEKRTILVIGGSLGSENINNTIYLALNDLANYNIIHVTGIGKSKENIKQDNYIQLEFVQDIENYYASADIVITRGERNTLFELLALKKTTIIIPLGTSQSRGDQIENAKYFQMHKLASVIYEEDLSKEKLVSTIESVFNNEKMLVRNMESIYKDGTKEVCAIIQKTLNNSKSIW